MRPSVAIIVVLWRHRSIQERKRRVRCGFPLVHNLGRLLRGPCNRRSRPKPRGAPCKGTASILRQEPARALHHGGKVLAKVALELEDTEAA